MKLKVRKRKRRRKDKPVNSIFNMDLKIPSQMDLLGEIGLTQSMIGQFLRCRQAFMYRINGISKGGYSRALYFGSLTHETLENLYLDNIHDMSGYEIKSRINHYLDKIHIDGESGVDDQTKEMVKAKVYALLVNYVEYYYEEFNDDRFDATEIEFGNDYRGIKLRGKIDGTFFGKDDRAWIIEHKTKGRISMDNLMSMMPMDLQNRFYLFNYALKTNVQPVGVIYNIIRRPGNKVKQNESLREFTVRMVNKINGKLDYYFKRIEVRYSKSDLEKFKNDLDSYLYEISNLGKGCSVYKNPKSCLRPWSCPYMQICGTGSLEGYETEKALHQELDYNPK